MITRWIGLLGLSVGLCGCWTTEPHVKHPTPDHEYILPPQDDPRWSSPPQYPEKTLNNPIKRDTTPLSPATPGTRSGPGGGRMGAGGMGGSGY